MIPVDTAPAPLRFLNTVLPMPQAADGLASTVLDGPGSVVAAVFALLLWGAAAFAVTILAARRAQRVDVRELVTRSAGRSREPDLAPTPLVGLAPRWSSSRPGDRACRDLLPGVAGWSRRALASHRCSTGESGR